MNCPGRFLARESARNLWAMLAGLILSFIQVKSDEHALGQWRNSQEPQGPEFELLAATQPQKSAEQMFQFWVPGLSSPKASHDVRDMPVLNRRAQEGGC